MTGLAVHELTVTYAGGSGEPAVRAASLQVTPGEIVGLLGPSGSGKSSLLGAVVGVVPVASGTVTFDDADVTHVPAHKRDFGLVFQDGQLFPHLNVHENIAYGLARRGASRAARVARVAKLLHLVGLDGFGARPIAELSGGERQRVALARSLAPQPRLLALDEPLSSLDAHLRTQLGELVREILKSTQTTSLLVTHDEAEAHALCDRVVRIREGRIVGEAVL